MMNDFNNSLTALPGTPQEQSWLKERLDTLSVRERYVLAAAVKCQPPESMADAINRIQTLDDYEVLFPANDHRNLGKLYLRRESPIPEEAYPYVDLDRLGQQYADEHPGAFIGNCYVISPVKESAPHYRGRDSPLPQDNDWSVKLRLASNAVPDGVWLRLPDYSGAALDDSPEVTLAMDALGVKTLENCTLLDAQCILPGAGDLTEQYESITQLVRDGSDLGHILDERGQGLAHFEERFAAALEYEDCHDLRFALDITQNLHCYKWVSSDELEDFSASRLQSLGVSEKLIRSGCIDLKGYAEDLLETSGYMLTDDGSGYICRNGQRFVHEYSSHLPPTEGMTMQ